MPHAVTVSAVRTTSGTAVQGPLGSGMGVIQVDGAATAGTSNRVP
jgi:hypothetical protein